MSSDEKLLESGKEPSVGKTNLQRQKDLSAGKASTLPKAFKASRAPKAKLDGGQHQTIDVLSLDRAQKRGDVVSRPAPLSLARGRAAATELQRPQTTRAVPDGGERPRNGILPAATKMKPRGKTAEPPSVASSRTKVGRNAAVGTVKARTECGKVDPPAAETVTLQEMGAHLRRLTEEHAKLQTEYARVRTLLQDANIKSSSRIASPVPLEQVTATTAVDGETTAERAGSEDGSEDQGDGANREGFRREVLRLKEELLAAHQQLTNMTEAKNTSDQELAQLTLRTEETGQELLSRDSLIEQLSRQVLQLKARANMQKAEHMQKMEEKEEEAEALARRLKEVENESRETKEFMQEENNSLTDALGEAEERAAGFQLELGRVQYELDLKEKHCRVLSQVLEQKQTELRQSQSDLEDTQDGAKEMLLKQGAELNGCVAAIRRIHQMADGITKRILSDAEALGVEVGHDEAYKKRRSSDGRKLVWAILQAASTGEESIASREDKKEGVNGSTTQVEGGEDDSALSTQMREVETAIVTLGRIQQTVNQFLFKLLNDAENDKTKLERDLVGDRKRLDEMQSELQENIKRRWALEEKNKELQKELGDAKENLKDSHDTLKSMWDKIDEKANWLIENKKLKEEIDTLRKQNSQLDARINLLSGELKETIANCDGAKHGNAELSIGEYAKKQVLLKEEISSLHRLLVNREEEMRDKCQRHERHQQVVKNNLLMAEKEVRRLDTVLDHVFMVLKSTSELQEHPVLKTLWEDLDGESVADDVEV